MKKIKYLGKEPTKVSIPGEEEKQDIVNGDTFFTHDHLAADLFKMYPKSFIEIKIGNFFEKNIGLWMFGTLIVTCISLLVATAALLVEIGKQ